MKLLCPSCNKVLSASEVNETRGVVMCRTCEEFFPLAELRSEAELERFDPRRVPAGAWYEEREDGVRFGVSLRNCAAFFLVPFTLVWGGGSLGGIYGSQVFSGEFNILLSLFGLPFLFGTIVLVSISLMMVAGKMELHIDGDEGRIFTGVGPIGWTRRFSLSETTGVELRDGRRSTHHHRNQSGTGKEIVLLGKEELRFGGSLSGEVQQWMTLCLKKALQGGGEIMDAQWESL